MLQYATATCNNQKLLTLSGSRIHKCSRENNISKLKSSTTEVGPFHWKEELLHLRQDLFRLLHPLQNRAPRNTLDIQRLQIDARRVLSLEAFKPLYKCYLSADSAKVYIPETNKLTSTCLNTGSLYKLRIYFVDCLSHFYRCT